MAILGECRGDVESAPNVTATSSLFGVTTLTQGFSYSSVSPRQIQLGAKISF